MNRFSIKDLEAYTGIKAHTLRVWEQRYGLVTPKRTPTNIRYYETDDLKRLLNVSYLNHLGYKISKLADLGDVELAEMVRSKCKFTNGECSFTDSLKLGMISYDKHLIKRTIAAYEKQYGLSKLLEELLFPFVCQIGTLWQTNLIDPCHEHFVSNIIRNKLAFAIEKQEITEKKQQKAILFLPDSEMHELGLLFMQYRLMLLGFDVVYLGQSVPVAEMHNAVRKIEPQIMVASVTVKKAWEDLSGALKNLEALCNDVDCELYVSSPFIKEAAPTTSNKIHFQANLKSLYEFVEANLVLN